MGMRCKSHLKGILRSVRAPIDANTSGVEKLFRALEDFGEGVGDGGAISANTTSISSSAIVW